ncbi:hypothetical protein [Calothrix sp. NIES-2098]|uniref:hypothetical protein n=1 Tax=Calothrix sp. NIES-2098 TaxID=1954171 RepID=UPI000B5F33A9|nr:hypothetical protein NIES2098_34600 [Calothrix sp. NIES-2098]
MPQNTLEIPAFVGQETVVSIARHREKKVSTKFNKPHCIVPIDDMRWVTSQSKIVQTLWHECWASDQFGSRWIKLQTSLSDKSFSLARKVLYQAGLFEFKRETCIDDSRKTAGWLVINLHGARRIKDYWLNDGEDIPNDGQELPNNSADIPNDGENNPSISPETLEKSSIPEPLSNSSITSQELLKEVPEEETTTCELVERVRNRGGKIGEKLANIMQTGLRLATVGQRPRDEFTKDFFKGRYRWRIDNERLNKLLNLNPECQQQFFTKFKYSYQNDGMSAPKTFDKVFDFVIQNTQRITEIIKTSMESFASVWEHCNVSEPIPTS